MEIHGVLAVLSGPALSICSWRFRGCSKTILETDYCWLQVALSGLGLWVIVYYNPHYAAPIMVIVLCIDDAGHAQCIAAGQASTLLV